MKKNKNKNTVKYNIELLQASYFVERKEMEFSYVRFVIWSKNDIVLLRPTTAILGEVRIFIVLYNWAVKINFAK